MKKSRIDIQQDILLKLLKPFVYIWMFFDAKRVVRKNEKIDFKRKEPFVMLANHTYLFDVVHVPLRFKKVPFIIASQTLFTKQPTKFLVSQVAHVIPKSKGKSDLKTIRRIYDVVNKGYPILIFPEGNTTFYGDTGYIEPSTMKLIKKLKLDVITCKVKGGYLSRPRWAKGKRKRHFLELNYDLTIPKEKLETSSLDEINEIISSALYHNEFTFQRERMIPHDGKHLAEGIENIVYVCPHCQAINTIESKGNKIFCTSCNKIGYIDKYGFIHDFVFDNLIDWNKYQLNFNEQLKKTKIQSNGFLNFMEIETEKQIPIGPVNVIYDNNQLIITGSKEITIPIDQIANPTITLRRDFGFEYKNVHYLINLEKYSTSFLRICQDKY